MKHDNVMQYSVMRCVMSRLAFRHILSVALLSLMLQIVGSLGAEAANRVALVIGQSAYKDVVALPNTANDSKRMTDLLTSAGFNVTTANDLTQFEMRQAIANFANTVAGSGPDTIVAVFYAGHGLQIDGENYLVPVDIDPKRESDIPLQAVRLNDLMNTLGALPTAMRIYMLDACRNNPFPGISGTAGHGLAMVDTKSGAPGSFISFSTSPGAEAEDGSGANSPYTTALLTVAQQPVPIEQAFKKVRVAVAEETAGRQIPWESSSLTADFRFFGADQASGTPTSGQPRPQSRTRSVEQWRQDLQGKDVKVAYDLVIAEDSIEAYEAFVALFNQPPYISRIQQLVERRREIVAWYSAVAVNTASSFQLFLNAYPRSDFARTAMKLMERVKNRSLTANAAFTPAAGGGSPAPAGPAGPLSPSGTGAPQPTNVSLAPTCPCTQPVITPVIKKNVDTTPSTKKRADPPKGHRPPTDADFVQAGPPPGPPPGAIMAPIIGGVLMGGGMRERGPVYREPMQTGPMIHQQSR